MITLKIDRPYLERVARGEATLTPAEGRHVVRELLIRRDGGPEAPALTFGALASGERFVPVPSLTDEEWFKSGAFGHAYRVGHPYRRSRVFHPSQPVRRAEVTP